jgi:hypothetical protein
MTDFWNEDYWPDQPSLRDVLMALGNQLYGAWVVISSTMFPAPQIFSALQSGEITEDHPLFNGWRVVEMSSVPRPGWHDESHQNEMSPKPTNKQHGPVRNQFAKRGRGGKKR